MNLAVFASGSGSNFEAILQATDCGRLSANVAVLLSDRSDAGALERASKRQIPTAVLTPKNFESTEEFGRAVLGVLHKHHVDFVALAGYLRKIPPSVVQAYAGRMVNIHPALLPAFGGKGLYGRRVHQAVLDYGCRWSGATVHLVDEAYDTGPVVLQYPVPVKPGDTPELLAERVLEIEHMIYPEALRLFAQGKVRVDGRHVELDELPPLFEIPVTPYAMR